MDLADDHIGGETTAAPPPEASAPRRRSLPRLVLEVALIAHVYAIQRQLDGATRDITQVLYARPTDLDQLPFLASMATYFGDCNVIEPRLLSEYDKVLTRLDDATGERR